MKGKMMKYEIKEFRMIETKNLTQHPAVPVYDGKTRSLDLELMTISVADIGILKPLAVTSKNEVIDGMLRLEAAKKVGLYAVPCLIFECDEPFVLSCVMNSLAQF